jgi:NAD(P)-dependent dehydrogenase (short-subunit alcohol dehydrogenase family)
MNVASTNSGVHDMSAAVLRDKTAVVTGASSGIGLATAIELARRGARVVMVCRDPRRAVAAQEEIASLAGVPQPPVVLADFLSLDEVRAAGEQLAREYEVIDILVNNAGAIFAKRELTGDGLEKTFAVNHLAPFLLTNLVLDSLKRSPAGRVVTVTSETYSKRLDFGNLQGEKTYNFFRAYQHSKLANILFTNELARRASGSNLTANSVSPGPAVTRFGDNMTGLPSLMPKVMKRIPFLFKQPEQAAEGVSRLAADPELATVTGRFFLKLAEQELKSGARDHDVARQLWEISALLTGLQSSPAVLVGAD